MNKIIILIFLLIILLLTYLNFDKINESFENKVIQLELIDSKTASEKIRNVKTFDKYNSLDKKLRKIKKNENIYNHYIKNLSNWNSSEIDLFNWLKNGLIKMTPKKYLFLYDNIFIAKYNDEIEMGFPHTHDDTIFFTSMFVNEILPFYTKNNIEQCIKRVGSVIIHETVHIWQRRDPEFFNKLFEQWKFTKYQKIYNFSKLRKKNRYNPDGVNLKWSWKLSTNDEIIPMAVYSKGATNISHVNLIGVRLEKIGSIPIIPPIIDFDKLNNISEYYKFFGNLHGNNYHPNELSAEIISRIITIEIFDSLNINTLPESYTIFIKLFDR
jgi:hypothetical protein